MRIHLKQENNENLLGIKINIRNTKFDREID